MKENENLVMRELETDEIETINGGGFWNDVATSAIGSIIGNIIMGGLEHL